MSCVLRAYGKDLDVDALLATLSLPPDSLWKRGERRFPNSSTNEERNGSSGARFIASEADFSQLKTQIEDAKAFLNQNAAEIGKLAGFPGVEGVVLDFGAEIHPPGWAWFTFPPELSQLVGGLGVTLCLSVYPVDEEEGQDA